MLEEYQKHFLGQFFAYSGEIWQVLAQGYAKNLQGKVVKVIKD